MRGGMTTGLIGLPIRTDIATYCFGMCITLLG